MVTVTVAKPVAPAVSVTMTDNVPAVLPAVKSPLVESIEPIEELLTDQEYDPVPPDAVKVCVSPSEIVKVDGETAIPEVMTTVAVAVLPAVSVAVIVTVPAIR